MIHILFLPGTFGSTVHCILCQFDKNYTIRRVGTDQLDNLILPDGSIHTFSKSGHYKNKKQLEDLFNSKEKPLITTPMYPMRDCATKDIIELFSNKRPDDRYIFLYVDDLDHAEINLLFYYHKVINATGGIEAYFENSRFDITSWNKNYTHWSQMQPWELREWFSIFYPSWVEKDWINGREHIKSEWLVVSTKEILNNTHETFLKIINYVGEFDLTLTDEFNNFVSLWRSKQQYVLDEYAIIDNIVASTISNTSYTWEKLNIIDEAIIQRKLRSAGYELRVNSIDEFPTNSRDLNILLEPL
jgi:hypothetical protein